jgi:uncharacterized protein (TIGR02246 family)
MKAAKLPLTTILMAFSLALAGVASDAGTSAKQPASEQKSPSSPADQTTHDEGRKYEEAYNKGDAKTLARLYSDDVDYIDQDGAEVKGRDAMEKLLADNFQQNPGAKLAITTEEVEQLRLIPPNIANTNALRGTPRSEEKRDTFGRFTASNPTRTVLPDGLRSR